MTALNTPGLSYQEAAEKVEVVATQPRVTKDHIHSRIVNVEYLTSAVHPTLTICILHLANGFTVTGTAAPVNAGNFDAEIGRTFAYEDAFKQIWRLEGYLLAEQRYQANAQA